MNWLDRWIENSSRTLAQNTSRRSMIKRLGTALVGASAMPLLPVARADDNATSAAVPESGDPNSCDYWRYCAIDGFLCGCCGGSMNSCPPGTEMSPITWIGTCRNPADGRSYIVSYNDCCGKSSCGNCLCNRNEGDKPLYRPDAANDINWCLGTKSSIYHCSTAILVGVALEQRE
ncbi:MAG: methylamine dehydrogenase light chain [Gammaproteobacteria bacterium]